ncbi:hypothetical protein RQP46_009901 [Phenoliferia psychrophenolica]
MAPPQIDLFTTSILSSGAIRSRHERVARHLASARIAYKAHDVASDQEAKRYWQRKNGGNSELPCVLVDGERVGSCAELDEAVEFGELRQFLRLDQVASSPAPAPTPTHATAAPIDEFASLDLTAEELASLETSPTFASSGFNSTRGTEDGTSRAFTFEATKPLSFSRGPKKSAEEDVKYVRALPGDRPLAQDARDDWADLGVEMSEEEANALARELGLDDPLPEELAAAPVEEKEEERVAERKEVPPPVVEPLATPPVDDPPAPSTTIEAEPEPEIAPRPRTPIEDLVVEPEPTLPSPIPAVELPTTSTSDEPLPTPSTSSPPSSDTNPSPPSEASLPPAEALAQTTSLPGPGGAALSAPLANVEALHLSPSEVSSLTTSPPPTTLEIEPVSAFERNVVAAAAAYSASSTVEEPTPTAETPSSVQDVAVLKGELNIDMGDTGKSSKQVPVVGVEAMEMEDKVAVAIRDGML